jgi:hypothetical protein
MKFGGRGENEPPHIKCNRAKHSPLSYYNPSTLHYASNYYLQTFEEIHFENALEYFCNFLESTKREAVCKIK